MNKKIDRVKPIQRAIYFSALAEVKSLTYPGYINEVIDQYPALTGSQIKNLIRGVKKSWTILNAIRSIIGLKEVWPEQNSVSPTDILKDLKLEKVA